MPDSPKVIILLETSREYGRLLQFGITKYSYFHGPWTFYREPGGRDRILPQLSDWGANGIIAHVNDKKMAKKILETDIPAVIKGYNMEGMPIIDTDNDAICKMGAEHLLERGFKNFAFCGFDDKYWSNQRAEVFEKRIAKEGYEFFRYSQPKDKAHRSWAKEISFLADWLKTLPKPIGIMTCVDERSSHVMQACKIANLDVPNEVAIIGVDNDELICRLSNPQLSSVALGAERAGYEAAELLDKLMSGKKVKNTKIITRPTHVVTRQSTDVLATQDIMVAKAIQFIHANSNEPIQVSDVVAAVPMSRRTLQLRFRRVLGRSILDEIRRARVDQISEMLVKTNMSVSNIALTLGFTGIDHIARFFRKQKGISPLVYRKKFGPK
jgi:LacI family transcriptional regulator